LKQKVTGSAHGPLYRPRSSLESYSLGRRNHPLMCPSRT
jgi:hypothetical protein